MSILNDGRVIWLTGLSGAGKSTIATGLKERLLARGQPTYVLDGDILRRGLCSDLTFSPEHRKENIRRVGEVANLFAHAGVVCVVALISPYRMDRNLVRHIIGDGRFIEVHVSAPIEVCEQRDPKGLYAKARAGMIKDFTGVSAPYEPPENPEVNLPTDKLTIAASIEAVLTYLDR
jgi:adenylyl-sulfate kinase